MSMQSAMWCLSLAGVVVVHQSLGGGSRLLQPLLGCCLILLPTYLPSMCDGNGAGFGL